MGKKGEKSARYVTQKCYLGTFPPFFFPTETDLTVVNGYCLMCCRCVAVPMMVLCVVCGFSFQYLYSPYEIATTINLANFDGICDQKLFVFRFKMHFATKFLTRNGWPKWRL